MAAPKRLVYWFASHLEDSSQYSIIARTKKEANELRAKHGAGLYDRPVKKVIVFKDAFDLFNMVTGEGGWRGFSNA